MAKIIIDSADLLGIAGWIEANCIDLGYVDEDSVDIVQEHTAYILQAVEQLRSKIRSAKPAEGVKK